MLAVRDEGAGPAVLLIHGFPLGSWMWDRQVRALAARGFRALAPDLRGFGASPLGMAPPATVDDHADDLAAVLGERGIERAAVVGFSMGGYVALSLAERRPDLLSALVLADTRAAADSEEGKRGRTALAERALKEGSAIVADAMAARLFAPATRERDPKLVEDVRARMAAVEPAAIASALGAMRDRPDRSGVLSNVRVPALVIVGTEDSITPPAEAEAMAAAMPAGARVLPIEGAGHLSNLERPEEFDRALGDFLDGALLGSAAGATSGTGARDLADMKCVPCKGGVPPLERARAEELLARLGGGWRLVEGHHLDKEYRFKNFREALAFTNHVGELAERVKHHPDIHLGWGKVRLTIWTHKIDGLTESDFVFAAKADRV